jgi:hypothetical protein
MLDERCKPPPKKTGIDKNLIYLGNSLIYSITSLLRAHGRSAACDMLVLMLLILNLKRFLLFFLEQSFALFV